MHALRQLLPRWTDEATNPLPPETPSAVEQVFRHLGFAATADVLALYGTLGGMRVMDNEYWRLWSFAEVAEQVPSESGILFSDYLMSSWDYRLKPISPEHSTV